MIYMHNFIIFEIERKQQRVESIMRIEKCYEHERKRTILYTRAHTYIFERASERSYKQLNECVSVYIHFLLVIEQIANLPME